MFNKLICVYLTLHICRVINCMYAGCYEPCTGVQQARRACVYIPSYLLGCITIYILRHVCAHTLIIHRIYY